MKVKQPWWQSLPPNKNKKNKVILEQYDKLKSSLPEWPWIGNLSNKMSIRTIFGHQHFSKIQSIHWIFITKIIKLVI